MSHDQPAYGLWLLVFFNSAIFILFAFSRLRKNGLFPPPYPLG